MSGSPYIYYGGAALPPPPYSCTGCRFVAHVFAGDMAAQQVFIDTTLNAATTPGRFQALSEFVFVIGVASAAIGSTVPPYDQQGTTAECDIGFWIAVLDTEQGDAALLQPAYLFVDNWLALAGGREIWGFPKALGVIQIGSGPLQDAPMVVSSLVVAEYGPQATASVQQVFQVNPPGSAAPPASLGGLAALEQALIAAVEGTETLLDLVNQSLNAQAVVMVLLKQFRQSDAEVGTVFSSVVRSNAAITALRGAGVVAGGYQLLLADFDSQPIARDLGLIAGAQSSIVGVWADLDFLLELSS